MLTIIPGIIPGIVLLLILLLAFAIAANRWHKNEKKLAEHLKTGAILPEVLGLQDIAPTSKPGDSIIEVKLKPRHFGGYFYSDKCAIGAALKEKFPDFDHGIAICKVYMRKSGQPVVNYEINVSTNEKDKFKPDYEEQDYLNDLNFVNNSININHDSTIRIVRLIRVHW